MRIVAVTALAFLLVAFAPSAAADDTPDPLVQGLICVAQQNCCIQDSGIVYGCRWEIPDVPFTS